MVGVSWSRMECGFGSKGYVCHTGACDELLLYGAHPKWDPRAKVHSVCHLYNKPNRI